MASPGTVPLSRPSGSLDPGRRTACASPLSAVLVAWQPLFRACSRIALDMICFSGGRHSNMDEYAPFGI